MKTSDLGALALVAVTVFFVMRHAMAQQAKAAALKNSVVVDYRRDPYSYFASDAAGRSIGP